VFNTFSYLEPVKRVKDRTKITGFDTQGNDSVQYGTIEEYTHEQVNVYDIRVLVLREKVNLKINGSK